MKLLHILSLLLLASLLALPACGKRGDPIRPGEEPKKTGLLP